MARLLIVDEMAAMRHFLRLILSEIRDTQVDETGDSAEAYRLVAQHRYDLAILDLDVPRLGGLELITLLRPPSEPRKQTPVIVISPIADEKVRWRARELGARIFPKPVQALSFLDVVRA